MIRPERSDVRQLGRASRSGMTIFLAIPLAMLIVAIGGPVLADDASPKNMPANQDINQRLYQQLEGSPSASKIETVSGQMYISQENIDRAVINDALATMLEPGAASDTSVAVRSAPRLNFEIHFQKNSADLTPESRRGLDELGEVLGAEYLDMRFVLGGHTDLDGDPGLNEPLSQARADSARRYLIERHGIQAERLVAKGYGESDPLREVEASAQDKLYNRRVDLRPMRGDEAR